VDLFAEKVFQFKEAPFGLDILAVGDAADRGDVHADLVGDVLEDQGPQFFRAGDKKVVLLLDDRLHDAQDRGPALVDGVDQPARGFEAVLDIVPGLLAGVFAVEHHPAVLVIDAQLGHIPVVHIDLEFAILLAHLEVGGDIIIHQRGVALSRLGVEPGDVAEDILDALQIEVQVLGELFKTFVLEILKMVADDLDGGLIVRLLLEQLDQQAFPQVAGADADRIETLDDSEDALNGGDVDLQALGDRLDGGAQVADGIDVPDDVLPDDLFLGRKRRETELGEEVVGQALKIDLGPLIGIDIFLAGDADLIALLVIEDLLPVDLLLFGGILLLGGIDLLVGILQLEGLIGVLVLFLGEFLLRLQFEQRIGFQFKTDALLQTEYRQLQQRGEQHLLRRLLELHDQFLRNLYHVLMLQNLALRWC